MYVHYMSTLITKLHKILLSSFKEVVSDDKMKTMTDGCVKNINPSFEWDTIHWLYKKCVDHI